MTSEARIQSPYEHHCIMSCCVLGGGVRNPDGGSRYFAQRMQTKQRAQVAELALLGVSQHIPSLMCKSFCCFLTWRQPKPQSPTQPISIFAASATFPSTQAAIVADGMRRHAQSIACFASRSFGPREVSFISCLGFCGAG